MIGSLDEPIKTSNKFNYNKYEQQPEQVLCQGYDESNKVTFVSLISFKNYFKRPRIKH